MIPDTNDTNPMNRLRMIISVVVSAFILLLPAFHNGFPFLYADTGTYLQGGFQGLVSEIRPITYGVFLRLFSMAESLWLVAFIQALIVSWCIHVFFRTFSPMAWRGWPMVTITALTLMTGLGEVTGMLMPDMFTAVMILAASMLLWGDMAAWKKVIMAALVWFGAAAHHSNAYILFLCLLFIAAWLLLAKAKKKAPMVEAKRLLLIGALAVGGFFTIPLLHLSYGGEFFWSQSKSVFLTNRINQMGLLRPFLQKHCAEKTYNLCGSIDQIPHDFLWDPSSPLNTTGGMKVNDPHYAEMLSDFFRDPVFLKKFVIKSVENGINQFFNYEGKIIFKEIESGYPYQVIQQLRPEFIPPIRRSMQYADQWDSKPAQLFQRFLVPASAVWLLVFFLFGKFENRSRHFQALCVFVLVALLANAFFCGAISMVDMRFQYRVIWLVPLLAFLLLSIKWEEKLLKYKQP